MCNIVKTRLLRPFSVITEITTKSPRKLYNRSFFGPFFYSKVLFFPIEKFFTSSPQNKISFWEALGTEPSQFLQAHHSAQRRQEPGSGEMCRGNGGQFCRGTGSVFLRYVSSRWLDMGKVVGRALDLWASTVAYFLVFLTSPRATQANKAALKTERCCNLIICTLIQVF